MNNLKCLILIFIISIFAMPLMTVAQVKIIEEPGVTELMDRYETLNRENPEVKAWKIQIIATNDRRKMETTISKFSYLYPSMEYEWKHAAPYYQVYIGAFEKKEDFQGFLLELKRDFPSAIPVIEKIEKEKLI